MSHDMVGTPLPMALAPVAERRRAMGAPVSGGHLYPEGSTLMGTLRLKSPPPPTALAAIARISGTTTLAKPKPAAPAAEGATAKPAAKAAVAKPKWSTLPVIAREKAAAAHQRTIWREQAAASNQRAAWRAADLALVRARYPLAFDPERPRPLPIGVAHARKPLADLLGTQRAKRLLMWWTSWPPYVAAIAAGGQRYRLDGTPAGEISDAHRAAAQAMLANGQMSRTEAEAA